MSQVEEMDQSSDEVGYLEEQFDRLVVSSGRRSLENSHQKTS
jgi:hypothetical protein